MKLLEIKKMNYSFSEEGQNNFFDFNFYLNKGEFLGVIGNNGSGKSTLMLIISGVKKANGEFFFNGEKKTQEEIMEKIGMVFQNPDNQFLGYNVEEALAFSLENQNVSREEMQIRIDKVLKDLNITNLKFKTHSELSGGEKQKLAIAEQIMLGKEIIIFDEPLSLLDPFSKHQIQNLIDDLQKKGKSIIYVTHDISELKNSDRIIHLQKWEIKFNGKINDFVKQNSLYDNFSLKFSRKLNSVKPKKQITLEWEELFE